MRPGFCATDRNRHCFANEPGNTRLNFCGIENLNNKADLAANPYDALCWRRRIRTTTRKNVKPRCRDQVGIKTTRRGFAGCTRQNKKSCGFVFSSHITRATLASTSRHVVHHIPTLQSTHHVKQYQDQTGDPHRGHIVACIRGHRHTPSSRRSVGYGCHTHTSTANDQFGANSKYCDTDTLSTPSKTAATGLVKTHNWCSPQ